MQATAEGEQVLVGLWAVVRRMKAALTAAGGDPAAVHIVHLVAEHGPLRLTALAERALLDASTVSRHVRGLEASGHLARTGDPDDRRASRIAVTDSGRALLRDALAARALVLDAALAGWPAEDRTALATLLQRLAEDMA